MTIRAALFALAFAQGMAAWSAESGLPPAGSVVARLAAPEERIRALLDLAAVSRFQQRLTSGETGLGAEALLRDRAWLERLQERFGPMRPRGAGLDPAAWWVYLKLQRQGLAASERVAPGGMPWETALRQVFNPADDRLAAALLPSLLWQVEAEATAMWQRLLEKAAADPGLQAELSPLLAEWFPAVPGPAAAGAGTAALPAVETETVLAVLASEALQAGPPNRARLRELRSRLLLELPALEEVERDATIAQLRLASLIDGLHEQRYTDFAAGLLSMAGELLTADEKKAGTVAAWIEDLLPDISSAYARDFARVDPSINSSVAAAYDIAQSLAAERAGDGNAVRVQEAADSAARLAVLIPDIGYYFSLPVRDTIAGTVDACTGLVASPANEDRPSLSLELFDDCLESLVTLADSESRTPGLSGDPDGPFGTAELQRELSVTPGQRINYALGYLHQRFSTACTPPDRPLPNPLEWSALATLLAWYAEQSPVFFQTPESERRLARMRAIGAELLDNLAGQVDCFAGSGASLSDPVSRTLVDYRAALLELGRALRESVQAHRARVLSPGADLVLEEGAGQSTTYRPEDVLIGPCDPDRVCEMTDELSSTRALIGLFPEPFLLADQSGLGEIALCYENMEWVERRSEPVRPDDTNVANYYGRFAFDLKGRFVTNDRFMDVFGFRFTSPDRYHYLFAAASDEVLADSCPMEWIGSRIVTPLPDARIGIVPNRLTYLAAARMLPSRLLSLNWDRGAEWRDWFITGIGVTGLEPSTPPDIGPQLTQHLQLMYRVEQAAIYDELFRRDGSQLGNTAIDRLAQLSAQKALIRMLIVLFYPEVLLESDAIRSAVAGQAGLVDSHVLERFRQDNAPVNSIADIGLRRLELLEQAWRQLPEASLRRGSIAESVAQAMLRLDGLYQSYFAAKPEAADAQPVTPEPADG
jgi:hypothetical protein